MVRQWIRFFKVGRADIHDEQSSYSRFVVSDDLAKKIDEKVRVNRRFMIS